MGWGCSGVKWDEVGWGGVGWGEVEIKNVGVG